MKAKKILAVILSVAMVATSGNFALDVRAANDGNDKTVFSTDAGETGQDYDTIAREGGTHGGDEEGGTHGGSDVIIDENAYFAVDGNGVLREKKGVPIESLEGTVELPAKARKIPKGIFNNNKLITGLQIPEDSELTVIESGAFERSGVTSLKLPDGVSEIAEATFKDSMLSSITFNTASTLASIGREAFAGSRLKKIIMPGAAKTIGDSAFKGCTSLDSFSMGNVEVIETEAFKGCTALQTGITWSRSLKEIGDNAFEGCGLTTLNLSGDVGSGIAKWGTGVFAGCEKLTSVQLHANMTTVPSGMFKGCTKLATLKFPSNSGCVKIEKEAFYGCDGLKTVTIPAKVGVIEANAFGGCQKLVTIIINQRSDSASGESDILLAEDAFPRKEGVTIKGYDGTVEEYAAKMGYTFVSLFAANKVSKKINHTSWGSVEVSPAKAKPGETVKVTVTPEKGYHLKASSFYYYMTDNEDDQTAITKFEEETSVSKTAEDGTAYTVVSQVFSFVMPEDAVTVHVDFTAKGYGTISTKYIEFESIGDIAVAWTDNKNTVADFDSVGTAARMIISSSDPDYAPGPWDFDYSSSNSKVAVVDSEGVIYACGTGSAKITVKLRPTGKTVTFTVRVDGEASVDHLDLVFSNLGKGKETVEVIDGESIPVIQFTSDSVLGRSRDFQVELMAVSPEGRNLFVDSKWKSANDMLAYPDAENVWDNQNTIHVMQGASGETAITVTATNGQTDKNKKVEYGEKTFIVRVIDATPRLAQSSLTVNARSTEGTRFDLISVYGYQVDPSSLRVTEDKKDGKVTEYALNSYVRAVNKNGTTYLELTQEGQSELARKGKDITYSNKTYIEGEYVYQTETGSVRDSFRTPIKKLVLTSKALKPSVKLSGKLNLFFNSSADEDDRGVVTVTQSLKDLKVESYELVSQANYAQEGSETPDPLANNFVVSADGEISRSENELMTDTKGKAVTKGYLKIKYEGYESCYVKITIPVQTKKPAYVLSMTKATVNFYSSGYGLRLQILDKKTKKPISLNSLRNLSFDESAAGLTASMFETPDAEEARLTDVITLKIKNVQKGKAIINVEMNDWNEPMKFTFNLSVSNKTPTVKAKGSTLTLNNLCIGREASTLLTVSNQDVEMTGISSIDFVGKDALAMDAGSIHFDYAQGRLSAKADGILQKGSYKFKLVPQLTYLNGRSEEAKAVNITVKVVDSKLTMAMKTKTLTLNNNFAGTEEAVSTYTIKNLPVSEVVNMDPAGVSIAGANTASQLVEQYFDITFKTDEQIVTVRQNAQVRKGTYKFKVSGLKTIVEGNEVEIQPFNVSVKVIDKIPKLTMKTSGSLNPCNGSSQITYVFKVTNVNVGIKKLDIKETNTLNSLKPLEDFTAEEVWDDNGNITGVIIRIVDGAALNAKTKYKLKMGILLDGKEDAMENYVWSSAMTVKFKQTLPKISTDVTTATVYAGVAADSPNRSQEIRITKKTEKDAVIENVVLAESNSDNLKKAFKASFDPVTQKATVTLVRPDLVKANTQYNVKLEVRVKGQMDNTKGPIFTVKVNVMN